MVDRQKFEEWCKELASVVGPSLFVLNGELRFRMSIDLEVFYERQEAVRDDGLEEGFEQGKEAAAKVCEQEYRKWSGEPTELGKRYAAVIRSIKYEPTQSSHPPA